MVAHYNIFLSMSDIGSVPLDKAYFGGALDLPIWLDDVTCRGTEMLITDCTTSGIGQHNCAPDHSEDAGVRCEGNYSVSPKYPYA